MTKADSLLHTSLRSSIILAFFLCLGFALGGLTSAAQTPKPIQAPPRITSAVDNAVRVKIAASKHPLAQPGFDRGAIDPATPMERMMLVLGASDEQEHQARMLLDSLHSQGSPNFHRWLTPEQFGQKFGPSPLDIQQVTGWLQQQGFHVNSVAKSGRWIEFSGNAAQVQAAFQTEMHNFMVEGQMHVANTSEVSIPTALSPVVRGVMSLHNFHSKPMVRRVTETVSGTLVKGGPSFTLNNGRHVLVPGDFATIYDLNPLLNANPALNGAGQTIAIVAASNIALSDVSTFRNAFGLPATLPNVILNGPDPGVVGGDITDEATLDVEWSGAAAPGATIDLVVSGGTLVADPISLSSSFIVDENLSQVMSVSFGACESAIGAAANAFWQGLWQQAAAQGISVFLSSGDQGAAGCAPNAPSANPAQPPAGVSGFASTQFNTAVGGTEFNETVNPSVSAATFWGATNNATFSSALGYIPERVWNDSCSPNAANSLCSGSPDFMFDSSGGGSSTVSGVPSWQMLNIVGLSGITSRVLPDVSLNAALHDPYLACVSTATAQGCTLSGNNLTFNSAFGGTSVSSPAFAGIMAIINQKVKNEHPTLVAADGRQGLANYVLYPLGAAESTSGFGPCNSSTQTVPTMRTTCAFNDITVGDNSVPNVTGFTAGTGFDLATGLGSVDANNLATQWSAAAALFQGTTTALSPSAAISITHGAQVQLTAMVTRVAATGSTPSGNISLVAQGGNLASQVGLGAAPISGSGATATTQALSVSGLPGGTAYSLSAVYPGDGTFAGSTSNAITVTVSPEASTTALASTIFNINTQKGSSGTTVAYGDPVNILALDATVVGASKVGGATGAISFTDGATTLGSIPLDNSGTAELDDCFPPPISSCLTPGTHVITAAYTGDLSFNPSTSSLVTITVNPGQPTVALSVPATAADGIAFTASAQVNTGLGTIAATGTIQFFDGTTLLGSPVTVSGNSASIQVTLNSGGNHSLTAQYVSNETATYLGATSAASTVNVAAPFNFSATTASQTIAAGGTATFNVTLSGTGGFTGQVTLTCTGAPGGSTCVPSPSTATLNPTTASIPVTVTVSNTAGARLREAPLPFRNWPIVFAGVLAGVLCALSRKPRRAAMLVLAIALVVGVGSCGGGGTPTPPPPTNATLTLTGTSGSTSSSITLNLTITH